MKYLFAIAGALACATPAVSATFFSDSATFDAATLNTQTVVLPNSGNVGLSETVGPLTFTSQSSTLFFGGSVEWSTLMSGPDLAISDKESFTVTFDNAVTAFSMLVHEPASSGFPPDTCNAACTDTSFTINILSGATILDSTDFNATDDAVTFFGATSTTAFTAVQIIDVTATIDNEYFNGFTIGQIAPVPLPASGLVMLGGIALAIGAGRKSPKNV